MSERAFDGSCITKVWRDSIAQSIKHTGCIYSELGGRSVDLLPMPRAMGCPPPPQGSFRGGGTPPTPLSKGCRPLHSCSARHRPPKSKLLPQHATTVKPPEGWFHLAPDPGGHTWVLGRIIGREIGLDIYDGSAIDGVQAPHVEPRAIHPQQRDDGKADGIGP